MGESEEEFEVFTNYGDETRRHMSNRNLMKFWHDYKFSYTKFLHIPELIHYYFVLFFVGIFGFLFHQASFKIQSLK